MRCYVLCVDGGTNAESKPRLITASCDLGANATSKQWGQISIVLGACVAGITRLVVKLELGEGTMSPLDSGLPKPEQDCTPAIGRIGLAKPRTYRQYTCQRRASCIRGRGFLLPAARCSQLQRGRQAPGHVTKSQIRHAESLINQSLPWDS